MDGYPQRDTIFEFDYFISLARSVGCFLFSLLSTRVLLASAASWFGCVVVLSLYFSAYLQISSLAVDIFKSLRISLFLIPYHRALTIVLSIFDCSYSSTCICVRIFVVFFSNTFFSSVYFSIIIP